MNTHELWEHHARQKKPVAMSCVFHDSIYRKYPEQANPYRWESDPGWEEWEQVLMRARQGESFEVSVNALIATTSFALKWFILCVLISSQFLF
jgi:hypothetical protein